MFSSGVWVRSLGPVWGRNCTEQTWVQAVLSLRPPLGTVRC